LYLDGVSKGNSTSNLSHAGYTAQIGRNAAASTDYMNGYISNLRIVNGTAVYPGGFTPSTSMLPSITNTTLLTCQSGSFVDNAPPLNALTVAGTPSTQSFSPFTGSTTTPTSYSYYLGTTVMGWQTPASSTTALIGQGYFSSTATFTVEAWIYPLSRHSGGGASLGYILGDMTLAAGTYYWGVGPDSNGKLTLAWYTGVVVTCNSTNAIPLNTWTHIAASINAGAISLYINGNKET
jgi:hypothetical protein